MVLRSGGIVSLCKLFSPSERFPAIHAFPQNQSPTKMMAPVTNAMTKKSERIGRVCVQRIAPRSLPHTMNKKR
jgi:hypothetical protein